MKRMMLAVACILVAVTAFGTELDKKVGLNELAPNIAIAPLLSPDSHTFLGLDKTNEPFYLNDIKGDVLVLELFNRFCMSCIEQAATMQSFWGKLETEGLKSRVKVLALGQGNGNAGVKRFSKQHRLTYPVGADPEFSAMLAFGDPGGTPLSLFLVREAGSWLLTDYHIGNMDESQILQGVKRLLAGERAPLSADRGSAASQRDDIPELTESNKALIISSVLAKAAGKSVKVKELKLSEGTVIYQAVDPATGPLELYVRVSTRRPVCDLCHTNVFAFAFDGGGKVAGFQPIYVTKIGNEDWTDEDTKGFESRLTGRQMTSLSFDPEIDAVTGASMSSSLIYDEIRKTSKMLDTLKK